MKKNPDVQSVLLSLAGFVLLWAVVTDAWGYSSFLGISSYVYALISRLIWVLPAVWLIFRYSHFLTVNHRTLFSRPAWNRLLAVTLAASFLAAVGSMLLNHGGFWLNPDISIPLETMKIIMVGFVEETVFRGWGYNALSAVTSERKAALYSTLFFVLLHWPAYFVRLFRFGSMDIAALSGQSMAALVWGIVFCMLMKKGRTLWHPVIVHIVYDILIILLAG